MRQKLDISNFLTTIKMVKKNKREKKEKKKRTDSLF